MIVSAKIDLVVSVNSTIVGNSDGHICCEAYINHFLLFFHKLKIVEASMVMMCNVQNGCVVAKKFCYLNTIMHAVLMQLQSSCELYSVCS